MEAIIIKYYYYGFVGERMNMEEYGTIGLNAIFACYIKTAYIVKKPGTTKRRILEFILEFFFWYLI